MTEVNELLELLLDDEGRRIVAFVIWGFDHNFADYKFKINKDFQTITTLKFTPLARYYLNGIKGFSEMIVGELVVKSSYECVSVCCLPCTRTGSDRTDQDNMLHYLPHLKNTCVDK